MMSFWRNISFDDPWVFALMVIPLLLVAYYLAFGRRQFATLKHSNLGGLLSRGTGWRGYLKNGLPVLRVLSLASLLLALARPQSQFSEETITTEGIDIAMSMDVSSSMLARDFKPNRLESAKKVATEFIQNRPNDRIGLAVFAGESFTQCPITTDKKVLESQLSKIKNGLLEDGTAIGEGMATAVARLKDSEAKSKVVILLTDGENNRGVIDPGTAAELSLQYGVRIYTIGVGSKGMAEMPVGKDFRGNWVYDQVEVNIDEKTLKEVARKTGGRYFRATSETSLRNIYQEIDQMEKTRIEVASYTRKTEEFHPFAFLAGAIFLLDLLLNLTITRSLP